MASNPRTEIGPEAELGQRTHIITPSQRRFARSHWANALFLFLAVGILIWVSWEAARVRSITYDGRADYWEHSAALHALIENPWHPKNPHLLSDASSPRFGPQFILVAELARAFHLDAIGAMSLSAALNTLLFLGSMRLFFAGYFRDDRAALYGLVVMLGSWWRGWYFSNVYQLNVFFSVASYPSTTALGLTLLGFYLGIRTLRAELEWPRLALALLALWAFTVLVVHQLTAVMSLSGLVLLALTEPKVPLRLRLQVVAMVVVGSGLSHFWPYFSPWDVLAGGKSEQAHWLSHGMQQVVDVQVKSQRHAFYRPAGLVSSLGLSLLGLFALPYFLLRRERWFVGVGALSMLVPFVVNAFIEVPLGHRFILLAIFYLQVGVVWLLLILTPGSVRALPILQRLNARVIAASGVAAVLLVFGYHNFALAETQLSARRFAGAESPIVRDGRAVAAAAGPNAVVLASGAVSWPLPTFGPKVLLTLHQNPLVPDEQEREASVSRFLDQRTPNQERLEILAHYHVTHVLLWREGGGPLGRFLAERSTVRRIGSAFRLYTLGPIADRP